MSGLWGREPALVLGLVQAVIAFVVVLGFDLPAGFEVAALGLSAAILSIITRSRVTPTGGTPAS